MTEPREDPDWLASWRLRDASRKVSSPDGREWIVEAIRVAVPRMTNYHPFWLLVVLGGWIYHQLRHRGEWRLQVTDVDEGTVWELGIYSREEAEAQVALHVTELEAGRWTPHPRDEAVVHDRSVARALPSDSVDSRKRRSQVVSVLLGVLTMTLLVLLFALDDLRAPQVVGLIAGGALALVALLRWGSWRSER